MKVNIISLPTFLMFSPLSSEPEKQCKQPGRESRSRAGPCGRGEVSASGQSCSLNFQSQRPLDWRPLLLVIPLRMGINSINPVYIQAFKVQHFSIFIIFLSFFMCHTHTCVSTSFTRSVLRCLSHVVFWEESLTWPIILLDLSVSFLSS